MAVLIRLMTLVVGWLVVFSTASYGRMVGGKTEISNVRTNEEVQDIGRYSVEEYNRSKKVWKEGEGELQFVEVVEAQQQVVSGIKYYMKLWVTRSQIDGDGDGVPTMFDSVVVVKPWLNSKHLLHFAPSTQ
ncbi:cysteine proteinase inhibitor B-like [Cicer arietinum]|uniref:Cysteine proteinase inhibitor 4-like n=1 Tax=Cicer arietinum TaxID=3827 RepID=A0A1S2YGF6_CICAR|nr:cysteine proteinase inhibitor 4-like [Cicer arietinum]